MSNIPWWGLLIIAVISFGAFLLALAMACIIAGAVHELKSAKTRAELDKAMRRHPSHRSHRPTQHDWPAPPF